MREYVEFLNSLSKHVQVNLDDVEDVWVEYVRAFFAGKPFRIKLDSTRSLRLLVRDVLTQAEARQRNYPGMQYAGAVMQHLVGAKLECALGKEKFEHNSFSTSDVQSGRLGDFHIGDVAIHVTIAPGESVIRRCEENYNDGYRPIIVTTAKGANAAQVHADNASLQDVIDIF